MNRIKDVLVAAFLYMPIVIIITLVYIILGVCFAGYYVSVFLEGIIDYMKGVIDDIRFKR